jgi:hypothetical protein
MEKKHSIRYNQCLTKTSEWKKNIALDTTNVLLISVTGTKT